eukprot:9016941-Pyramimonas_sp.AAC.1
MCDLLGVVSGAAASRCQAPRPCDRSARPRALLEAGKQTPHKGIARALVGAAKTIVRKKEFLCAPP